MSDPAAVAASAARLLGRLETARLSLVDRLAALDQCPLDEHEQEAFRVLVAYLRLNRQNKAGKVTLRLNRKQRVAPNVPIQKLEGESL